MEMTKRPAVRVPDSHYKKLQQLAKLDAVTLSSVIRRYVDEGLKRDEARLLKIPYS